MEQKAKAFVCIVRDGTSLSAMPEVMGVALNEEDAKQWVAALPKGSWDSRSYYSASIITGDTVTLHN